ncbi:MAG: Rnase Y domain-containing protein, partial [Candidatus Izemoplasmatales bacterium]
MLDPVVIIISSLLGLIIGVVIGFIIRIMVVEKGFQATKEKTQKLIDDATTQAEKLKKEKLLEARQEIYTLNLENDKILKEKKANVQDLENKLNQREDLLERRSSNLDKRELNIDRKEENLDEKKMALEEKNSKLESIIQQQNTKLFEIANFTEQQARDVIMERVEADMVDGINRFIRDAEENAKADATKIAKDIISQAIQK